jgi:hypothetical protein
VFCSDKSFDLVKYIALIGAQNIRQSAEKAATVPLQLACLVPSQADLRLYREQIACGSASSILVTQFQDGN